MKPLIKIARLKVRKEYAICCLDKPGKILLLNNHKRTGTGWAREKAAKGLKAHEKVANLI